MSSTRAVSQPQRLTMPNGDIYSAVLLKIETKDEFGRPETLTYLPEDRPVEVVGQEEFIVAYLPDSVIREGVTL